MRNKMMEYYRIRDIVYDIYTNYVYRQIKEYGEAVDGVMLAEESMLLILDILNNKSDLSNEEIANMAIKEANIEREWHK